LGAREHEETTTDGVAEAKGRRHDEAPRHDAHPEQQGCNQREKRRDDKHHRRADGRNAPLPACVSGGENDCCTHERCERYPEVPKVIAGPDSANDSETDGSQREQDRQANDRPGFQWSSFVCHLVGNKRIPDPDSAAAEASGTFFREAAHDAEDRCDGRCIQWLLGSPRFAARLNLADVPAFSRSYV